MNLQKTVKIVNVKKSMPDKKFEQTIFETIWLKRESFLREQGWMLEDEIKEVIIETVEDNKGIETFTIEEEIKEEVIEDNGSKDYSEMSKEELQAACDEKGIKYHHANKITKLISLLEA